MSKNDAVSMWRAKPAAMRHYFTARPRMKFFSAPDRTCLGYDNDIFYPIPGDLNGTKLAKSICQPCPYRTECFEYALKYREEGIWGATTERERAQIIACRRREEVTQAREKTPYTGRELCTT